MIKKLAIDRYWLLICVFATSTVYGKEIRVCNGCHFSSVREAVHFASPHDSLIIEHGKYIESTIYIDKSLSITGLNQPVIDGDHKGHVFYIRADDVKIKGLVIQNSGMSYISDLSGIRVEHVKNCEFRDNIIKNTTYAIYLEKVSSCLIEGNKILGSAKNEVRSGNGVHLFYSKNIKIIGNEITRQRDGLYFEFTNNSLVRNNYSYNNLRFGMHFMFSHKNKFFYNVFSHNPTGVAIMYSRNLEVRNNIFSHSKGNASYGFLIKEIVDSVFSENTFFQNTLGIFLNGSNRNKFNRNLFFLNGWAIEIYSNSYDNLFTDNDFVSNNFDVSTNSRRSTSRFYLNYWSKYRGYDLNRDGKGDIPYRPVSVFSFWISRFPELAVLLNSPAVHFLEVAERFFPALTPKSF